MQSGSRQMQGQGEDKHTIDSDDEVKSANQSIYRLPKKLALLLGHTVLFKYWGRGVAFGGKNYTKVCPDQFYLLKK